MSLDEREQLCQDTVSPSLHLLHLLFGWGEDDRRCDRVESLSVGINDHIDHSSFLPVVKIVIAELDAKLTKESVGLLEHVSFLVDDGHAAEFSSVTGSLARIPNTLADVILLVVNALMLEKHNKRTRATVRIWKVLNLDSNPLRGLPTESTLGNRSRRL